VPDEDNAMASLTNKVKEKFYAIEGQIINGKIFGQATQKFSNRDR
jgi:hypothetical protein